MYGWGRTVFVLLIAATASGCEDTDDPGTVSTAPREREHPREHERESAERDGPSAMPRVFLIVDTSGSMSRLPSCACTTAACLECVPDCAKLERSSNMVLVEALTGTFERPGCTALQRTAANGATYDIGYYLPYHRPFMEEGQKPDGLIDRYGDRVRFGVGTFDGHATYGGSALLVEVADFDATKSESVAGLWSFGSVVAGEPRVRGDGTRVGTYGYQGTRTLYMMDTGLRSTTAQDGALVWPGAGKNRNAEVESSVLRSRPFGGTPLAAALDDLDFYLRSEADARSGGPIHVLVITDGFPDDDYRSLGCNCPNEPETCTRTHPDFVFACPYPLPAEAVRALRCGYSAACDDGVVEQVFVVAFHSAELSVTAPLDAMAVEGGTRSARLARAESLSATLSSVLDEILAKD